MFNTFLTKEQSTKPLKCVLLPQKEQPKLCYFSTCDSSSHLLHVPSHYWCYTKIPSSCFIDRPHILQGNM